MIARAGLTQSAAVGLVAGAALLAITPANAQAPEDIATAIARSGELVLPLSSTSAFPLVDGEANGRAGYFLIDTGTPYTAFLNATFIGLPPGKELSRGAASSGQKIVVYRNACLRSLRIASRYTLSNLCDLPGTDLTFVAAEMKLPILGFLGDALFEPYRLTFDWSQGRAILTDRRRPIEPGALTTFSFAASDKQVPTITVMAGEVALPGGMDSGDPGHVTLSRADAAKLFASGRLIRKKRRGGATQYILAKVVHDGCDLDTSDLPVAITDDASSIMLGHLFLRRYRSTWDYRERRVTLYKEGRLYQRHL